MATSAEFIRQQKLELADILSQDSDLVLQHVDSKDIIPHNVYTDLKQLQNRKSIIFDLLDWLINDENSSIKFLKLLEIKDFHTTFPRLKGVIKIRGKHSSFAINLLGLSKGSE